MARCRLSDKNIQKLNKKLGVDYAVYMYRGGYGRWLLAFKHSTDGSGTVDTCYINRDTAEIDATAAKGRLSRCWCGCVKESNGQ
jgi:hypothetical protein